MDTSIFLILATILFFVTLVGIAIRFSSSLTDIVLLFSLVFGLFYGFRPLLFSLGLDVPYPDRFFEMESAPELAATTLLWLTVFLVCFAAGVYTTSELVKSRTTLFYAPKPPPTSRLLFLTVVLTALATVISIFMTLQYGGIGGFIRAVKIEKSLAGLFFFKLPATIGTLCAVATYVQMRQSTVAVARRTSVLVLFCAILDGFWVFIWGQRSSLVVLGVTLIIGTLSVRDKKVSIGTAVTSLLVAVALVLGVSTGLRYARDELVQGEVQDVVGEASVARQVSLGTNSVFFDSSMLAFRDWPEDNGFRQGEDFVVGAAGFVPRILWAGKPKIVKPGQWFRQVYQPQIENGWPIGAPTLWWMNFGPLGILLGGAISGLIFGLIRRAQMNSQKSGLNVAISLIMCVYVFQTGLGPEFPAYASAWLVPIWLMVWFLKRPGLRELNDEAERRASAPASTERAPAGRS